MASENVEIVRRTIESFASGDGDAMAAGYAPDAVVDLSRARGPYRGVYEIQDAIPVLVAFRGDWESYGVEIEEYIDLGDQVVTPFTNLMRGRDGIEVQARGIWLWTLRDRLTTHLCLYQDREEALAAAGLSS